MPKPPLEGVLLAIESGQADATCAKWKAKGGELGRAVLLVRRAQHQLAKAELRLIELEHEAAHERAKRPA